MARSRKEAIKPTPEERFQDIWNQHVFLITRRFPGSHPKIVKIEKEHTPKIGKADDVSFTPNFEATEEIRQLYLALVQTEGPRA